MIPKVALLQLGAGRHALPLAGIEQILLQPPVFPLPLLPGQFAGVFVHQGRPIPVLAPSVLGGGAAGSLPPVAPAYVIVCTTEYGSVGLPVDRVLRIVEQGAGSLLAADQMGTGVDLFLFQGERYPLCRPDRLIASPPCHEN